MLSLILDNHSLVRLLAFTAAVSLIAAWEGLSPRRTLSVSKGLRWLNNWLLSALNSLLLLMVFPLMAVGLALLAGKLQWGLFNVLGLPYFLAIPLFILLFDLTIYWQHRLFHMVPWLWRLHRVHHADPDFDVSTGIRFHPLSMILSMLIKMLVVLLLGPPAVAVLLAEITLNLTSMFNHGNISIPPKLDAIVRLFVVTPDMHRVHHSSLPDETNSNFGFNFPWWDRLFGTYRAQPSEGHCQMEIGITGLRAIEKQRLDRLLLQPLVK